MKAEDNRFPYILLDEQGSNPATPDAGTWRAFMKAGGLYVIDDAGIVTGPMGPTGAATFAGVRVYNSAAQTIATATDTILLFDSEAFDTDGFHSTSSNTGRLTVPAGLDGYYHIGGTLQWVSDATGYRQLYLRLNATTNIDSRRQDAVGSSNAEQGVGTLYHLAAGDYVEMKVRHTKGSNLDTVAVSAFSPEFWMYRVGA